MKLCIDEIKKFELSFQVIDELWLSDIDSAEKECEKRNEKMYKQAMKEYQKQKSEREGGYVKQAPKHKISDKKDIEEYAIKNGKLSEYLKVAIIPSRDGGYFVVENGNVVLKSKEAFNKVEKKLNAKSKSIIKHVIDDCTELYTPDVYADDFLIDTAKFRINLAKRFNYGYKPDFNQSDEVKNKVNKLLNFIKEVITSNINEEWECLKYVIGCMAKRKQSQVVTFLTGLGGIGKTFFTNILNDMFGQSYASTSEATLSGDNQFNMMIVGAVIAVLEETSGRENYQKMMSKIKELATSKELTARKMYVEGFQVANMLNIFVLSNHFRDIDCGERRVFCPTLNNKYQNDQKYFAELAKCLEPEVLQCLFNYFYEVDVSQPVRIPDNLSKQEARTTNMSYPVQFAVQEFLVKDPIEKRIHTMRECYTMFEKYCWKKQIKNVTKFDLFSKTLRDYVQFHEEEGKPKMKNNTNTYDFGEKNLINRFVERAKLFSLSYLDQERAYYKEKARREEDDLSDCEYENGVFVMKNNSNEEVADLKKENADLKRQIEELQAQLNAFKQPKVEEKKKEKVVPKKVYNEKLVKVFESFKNNKPSLIFDSDSE